MDRYGGISPLVKLVVVQFLDLGLGWLHRLKKGICLWYIMISRTYTECQTHTKH